MNKVIIISVCAILALGTAQAAQIGFDNFDYADGPLVNNAAWVNHSGTVGDMLVVSGEVIVKEDGSASEDASYGFSWAATGDIYYGIDFYVEDLGAPYPGAGTDYEYFAHFKDDAFAFSGRISIVPPTGAGDFSVGLSSISSTEDVIWATDLTYGTWYRVVVRYNVDTSTSQMWIDASAQGDTSVSGIDQPDPGNAVTNFALRQSSSDGGEFIHVDNLVIGTLFDDVVTPVPVELQSFSIE